MSALKLLSALLCLAVAVCEPDINDFDHTFRGYEIIFHDTKDLGLLIHGDNCYFLHLPDATEELMQYTGGLLYLESQLVSLIEDPHRQQYVRASSLDIVRDKYQDRLADFHCADKVIFELAVTVCAAGWSAFRESCYKYFDQHVDQDRAVHQCQEVNSHLVEITSLEENNFVNSLMKLHAFHDNRVWLGLDDKDTEGRFVLTSSGNQLGFQHWSYHEPDDYYHRQDCAVMQASGLWQDTYCSEHHPFVCEM